MAVTCGCTPGSFEDGWREQRSAECVAVEIAGWSAMLDRVAERARVTS